MPFFFSKIRAFTHSAYKQLIHGIISILFHSGAVQEAGQAIQCPASDQTRDRNPIPLAVGLTFNLNCVCRSQFIAFEGKKWNGQIWNEFFKAIKLVEQFFFFFFFLNWFCWILRDFSHRHILKNFGYFHDEDRIYMVLEYAKGGSLFTILKTKKTIPEQDTAMWV